MTHAPVATLIREPENQSGDFPVERPWRVMFLLTSMPVGGTETLLVNLVQRLDPTQFAPEVCLLKEPGPLGERLAEDFPVTSGLLKNKYDVRVLPRLRRLMQTQQTDAVITVGAGDKMFWGRLAARTSGVPVVISALHSTGWPDGVGRLNRCLTRITDAFIAVAPAHGRFLIEHERFPEEKVHVIPNGVDTNRFAPLPERQSVRRSLGLSAAAPVVTLVAALRPEKNHEMLLRVARRLATTLTDVQFLLVGDGPQRAELERLAAQLEVDRRVHFLGSRDDVPRILTATDVFALTSHNEANPVSILEALSCGCPVVATDVGSVSQSVVHGKTGLLVKPGDAISFAGGLAELLVDPLRRQRMGEIGRRRVVARWSVDVMVRGYERLIQDLLASKLSRHASVGSS